MVHEDLRPSKIMTKTMNLFLENLRIGNMHKVRAGLRNNINLRSRIVPGAGMVMLVIVLEAIGFPADKLAIGLALIFAVDRPLDMLRTVVNITGDATVSMMVAKSVGQTIKPKVKNWDDNLDEVR